MIILMFPLGLGIAAAINNERPILAVSLSLFAVFLIVIDYKRAVREKEQRDNGTYN
jgi:hypothetical protein